MFTRIATVFMMFWAVSQGFAQDAPSPLIMGIQAAKKNFEQDYDPLLAKLKAATSESEKEKIKKEIEQSQEKFLNEIFAVVKKYPDTEESFAILAELTEVGGDASKRAVELMAAHHTAKPWIAGALGYFGHFPDPIAGAALEAVLKNNTDPKLKGLAQFFLGIHYKERAIAARGDEQKQFMAEAEKHLNVALRDHAEVTLPRGRAKVGELAKNTLVGLKNLPHLVVGGTAPEIAGVDLDGQPMKLSGFKGQVVLLDFWASWCGPCMAMVPDNKALVARFENRPFSLIGINTDEEMDDARAAITRHKITWRSFKNSHGDQPPLDMQWNVDGLPSLYLVDHTGVIRKIWTGLVEGEELASEVQKLVKEAEAAKK